LAVATDSAEHAARCVIVASGAKLKRLGVPGEAELEYKGVSQCADCDGPLFRGEDVVVVGGGDSALQEALVLASCCANVRIVHHAAQLSAHSGRQEAIRSCGNISVLPMSEVTAIEGAGVVKAVRVRSLTDGSVRALPCGGVFVYVGLSPSTGFLPREVARDASGAAQANDALETSLANVFVAGAARAGFGGTLSDAVRDGRTVAAAVFQRLRGA
jgi:thioredoxin reductase (NADPH)